jgi:hypothetical protein
MDGGAAAGSDLPAAGGMPAVGERRFDDGDVMLVAQANLP